MDETRRTVLSHLHELTLEAAVDRLLELGVLDAATLSTRRDEQLRLWRGRSAAGLDDELEALRRQRRHATAHVELTGRRRQRASAASHTVVQLDELRPSLPRSVPRGSGALDSAHRALGAALAALALLEEHADPETAADLIIEPQRFGDRLVLRLEGEIDIATAPRLNEALAAATDAGVEELWVDLIGVTFMDSTGIAALLRATHALPGPRRLAVICPDGPARRALELCGLGRLLPVHAERPAT